MSQGKGQSLTRILSYLIFFSISGIYFQGYAATDINSLPYTISSSGEYRISQDLSISSGTGINIEADNVTLFGTGTGTKIVYSVNDAGIAVRISDNSENILIQDITLHQENIYSNSKGIAGSSLRSFVVDNVTINVKSGVSNLGYGIDVSADSNSHIQNCSINISGESRFYGIDKPSNIKIHDCTFTVSNHTNGYASYPYVIYNPHNSEIYNNHFEINGSKVNVFGSWGGDDNLIYGNTINYDCIDGGRVFLMNGGANGWDIYDNTITVTSNTNEAQYVLRIRGIDGSSADNNLFHHNTIDISGAGSLISAISLGDNSPMYGNKIYSNVLKSNSNVINFYSSEVYDTEIFCNEIQALGSAYPVSIRYRTPSNVKIYNNTYSTERTDGKLVHVTESATGITFCNTDITSSDLAGGGTVTISPDVCQPNVCDELTSTFNNDRVQQIDGYELSQNYPNPFNPVKTIKYSLPVNSIQYTVNSIQYTVGSRQHRKYGIRNSEFGIQKTEDRTQNQSYNQQIIQSSSGGLSSVKLVVYDILGKEVAILVNDQQRPGIYEVKWDASHLSSGVYLYKLQAGKFVQVKKLILMK